jgi:hypothetical protein
MKDLLLFMLLLLIFIVNYGVVSKALMYPNIAPDYSLILQPYLMIFGSMDTAEVQGLFFIVFVFCVDAQISCFQVALSVVSR